MYTIASIVVRRNVVELSQVATNRRLKGRSFFGKRAERKPNLLKCESIRKKYLYFLTLIEGFK